MRWTYIPENVHRVAAVQFRTNAQQQEAEQRARILSIERAHQETSAQLAELTGLRLRNLLADTEFLEKRKELQQEQLRLTQQRDRVQNEVNRFEPAEDVIFFRNRAIEWFQHGELETKKLILETVGSNLTLMSKILNIEARKPFKRQMLAGGFPRQLAFIDDVRKALDDNPEETALIQRNIKLLREHCEGALHLRAA